MSKGSSKSPIAAYFEGRLNALFALGEAVAHPHSGLAGGERETLIGDFLKAHLPPMLAVGAGMVFGYRWAHDGASSDISTEQDIVIYRHDMPILKLAKSPLYFRESVVATIEVRTNYISGDLGKLLKDASSVRRVEPVPTFTLQMGSQGHTPRSTPRRVLCGVFYFRGPKTRSVLVNNLNELLAARAGTGGDMTRILAPDFFFSVEAGLVVRNEEFDTLFDEDVAIEGRDSVYRGLMDSEKKPGAYRRVFGDSEKWRGLQALVLELAERCQRYSVSYASLSQYA